VNYAVAIRIARAARGLRKDELARAAGLDPSYISLLECGKRQPSDAALEALAGALGFTECDLRLLAGRPEDIPVAEAGDILVALLSAPEAGR
jgi:transcriptional regulator with XRE-family HTH domain